MRGGLIAFWVLLAVVFASAVRVESTAGEAFRTEALRPVERERSIDGVRGRILSSDGQTLATEKETLALAMHYRHLQDPPDPAWLRRQLNRRLPRGKRNQPDEVQNARNAILAERRAYLAHLAELCGVDAETFRRRADRVQMRVERIVESVNQRRDAELAAHALREEPPPSGWKQHIARALGDTLRATVDDPPPPRVVVGEELDYHLLAEDLSPAVAAAIEAEPERYPNVRILRQSRRYYPLGSTAAHAIGHLGLVEPAELQPDGAGPKPDYKPDDFVGRMGIERQYERLLRGRRGLLVETTDHSGRVLSSRRQREPAAGRNLVLTLDARLQTFAETLLENAIQRQSRLEGREPSAGGAIVVLDVDSGAVRAMASTPRFDPNAFALRQRDDLSGVMDHPARPLFDRASRMAIAPGSTFKTLTAIALVESRLVDAEEEHHCLGYLHTPDRQRCELFVRQGKGHGDVTLYDALAQSCNVYFFHHAGRMGAEPLIDWAWRFGFARPTGIDLPSEAAGRVPTPETIETLEGHAWQIFDTQAIAIGQGSLTATPLQMAVLMSAVANGGALVTPHVLGGLMVGPDGAAAEDDSPRPSPRPVPGLRPQTLEIIRAGLEMVVADPHGTAHGTVLNDEVAIAGKTGTAETGGGRASHAWFAGYAPARRPKLAFVIVLEHGGSGAVAAGPLASRLVVHMRQLGLL
jgi:penicillin-binding protein 2